MLVDQVRARAMVLAPVTIDLGLVGMQEALVRQDIHFGALSGGLFGGRVCLAGVVLDSRDF